MKLVYALLLVGSLSAVRLDKRKSPEQKEALHALRCIGKYIKAGPQQQEEQQEQEPAPQLVQMNDDFLDSDFSEESELSQESMGESESDVEETNDAI